MFAFTCAASSMSAQAYFRPRATIVEASKVQTSMCDPVTRTSSPCPRCRDTISGASAYASASNNGAAVL